MPSSHLILCCPLLLLPAISPSIRVFSNESTLHMRWPKYWSFSFSISPSNEYSGLISFRMDWLDLPLSNICGNGSTKRLTNDQPDAAAKWGAGSQSQPQTALTVCNNNSRAHGSRVTNLKEADPLSCCLVPKSCLTLLQLHGL